MRTVRSGEQAVWGQAKFLTSLWKHQHGDRPRGLSPRYLVSRRRLALGTLGVTH